MKMYLELLFLLFSVNIFAQSAEVIPQCGTTLEETYLHESKQLVKERSTFTQNFIRNQHSANARNSNDLVPIQVHIIRRSNSTGGIDLGVVNTALAQLNTYFANANLEFFQCASANYIDNDTYYDFERADSDDDMIPYLKEGAINLFFTGTVNSFGLHVGGYASIPNQYQRFVMLENGFISGSTLVEHEMGHIFGLAHTHGQWGHSLSDCPNNPTTHPLQVWCQGAVRYYNSNTDENNDGINDCEQTGDEVCDTPADPNLNGNVTGCTYTGTGTDYFGDAFNPLMNNVMSYGPNNCINSFTTGQYARMRFWYDTYLQYTTCNSCNAGANITRTVINTNDAGVGSLRWALDCANSQTGQTTINFNILGSNDKFILLQSPLPQIYKKVIIDGTTQPQGKIILEYVQVTDPNSSGLVIETTSSGCEVYGLTIQNSPGSGIVVSANNVKIGAINKGNIIKNSGTVTPYGFGVILYNDASNVEIVGNRIENNGRIGVDFFGNSNNVLVSRNSFYCNQFGIYVGDNANGMPTRPWINSADNAGISGGSAANAIVEVFVGATCSGGDCEGETFLGTAIANGSGIWTLPFPFENAINNRNAVIATARLGNNSSAFGSCYTYTGSNYTPPPNCQDDEVTSQTRNIPIPDTLSAMNSITSTDIIEEMANVTYLAGQAITLNVNFHAKANSTFSAKIMNDCTNNFSNENNETVNSREVTSPIISKNSTTLLPDLAVFPNPFSNQTNIHFNLKEPSPVQITLYNLNGQQVKTLIPPTQYETGQHQLTLRTESLPNGIYFLALQTATNRRTKKLIIQQQ